MLAVLVSDACRGKLGMVDPHKEHQGRPIGEHVDDYLNHLRAKNGSPRHVQETGSQIRTVRDGCRFKWIGAISSEVVEAYLLARWRAGMSIERSNHYVRAIKGFSRWLEPNRLAVDPLRSLHTLNPETDRRLKRRALPLAQFVQLIEAARLSPRWSGVWTAPHGACSPLWPRTPAGGRASWPA